MWYFLLRKLSLKCIRHTPLVAIILAIWCHWIQKKPHGNVFNILWWTFHSSRSINVNKHCDMYEWTIWREYFHRLPKDPQAVRRPLEKVTNFTRFLESCMCECRKLKEAESFSLVEEGHYVQYSSVNTRIYTRILFHGATYYILCPKGVT